MDTFLILFNWIKLLVLTENKYVFRHVILPKIVSVDNLFQRKTLET